MRFTTYHVTMAASLEHPWVGHSALPLAEPLMLQARNAPLPSIHSSWLALAFYHGWLSVLACVLLLRRCLRTRSRMVWSVLVAMAALALWDDLMRYPGSMTVGLVTIVLSLRTQEGRHA